MECSTSQGVFAILALDQRSSLRKAIKPDNPDTVSYEELVSFKQHIIKILAPETSAVLLDPEYGAAQNITENNIPGSVGLIVAVEETGYTGDSLARQSQILKGWDVKKAEMMGANAVKLLVYYHPDSELADRQCALISEVAEACRRLDIALFLEPIVYSIDLNNPKISPIERREIIVRTARDLNQLGADVLKLEFPIDCRVQPEETIWKEACQEVTEVSKVPWVLLSAGVDYNLYRKQAIVACTEGASGVMAGRAIWKEAIGLSFTERDAFLRNSAILRIKKLRSICDGLANPWITYYPSTPIPENWYLKYSN